MSDLDHFYAERVRKALVLRDGCVNYGDFCEALLDKRREMHRLPTSPGRLEIQGQR